MSDLDLFFLILVSRGRGRKAEEVGVGLVFLESMEEEEMCFIDLDALDIETLLIEARRGLRRDTIEEKPMKRISSRILFLGLLSLCIYRTMIALSPVVPLLCLRHHLM